MKKLTIVFAALLIAACSSTTRPNTAAESAPAKAEAPATSSAASTTGTAPEKSSAESQDLSKQSVYFAYDESAIAPEFKEDIQKQAAFIKNHKNETVTLEGNCDERGSAEYNLALGQRRANAVKKLLLAAGVGHGQIKTVSEGKEHPRLTCHEEKCWKENRRVDFVHAG